jgi:hypothetical protein
MQQFSVSRFPDVAFRPSRAYFAVTRLGAPSFSMTSVMRYTGSLPDLSRCLEFVSMAYSIIA